MSASRNYKFRGSMAGLSVSAVNASLLTSRWATHDSRPRRFATPFLYRAFTDYHLPVCAGALPYYFYKQTVERRATGPKPHTRHALIGQHTNPQRIGRVAVIHLTHPSPTRCARGGVCSGRKFESDDARAGLTFRFPQVVSSLETKPHISFYTHPCLQP